MIAADDLRAWAWSAHIESTKQVGSDRVRLVLLRLVEHADPAGRAFPGSKTVADNIPGLSRRDVDNAFAALESQGLIIRAGTRSRARVWQLAPDHVLPGMPRKTAARVLPGVLPGDLPGDLPGMPGTNGTERNLPPSPRHLTAALRIALEREGVTSEDDIRDVLAISAEDPDTKSAPGRLEKVPTHLRACVHELRSRRQRDWEAARVMEPRCEVCGPRWTVAECDSMTGRDPDRCDGPSRRAAAAEAVS